MIIPFRIVAACMAAVIGSACSPREPVDGGIAMRPMPAAAPALAPLPTPAATVKANSAADFGEATPTAPVRYVADRAISGGDARGLPFLIVDKLGARLLAFDAGGRLVGSSPVLLGLARGDDSVPGIGERRIADIRPEERTTPAGRFDAELGENSHGEDILWVDYDNAISMHRVRANKASERRLQRLASPNVDDNRISYGCINVPAAFYDSVIKALFAPRNGVVYVLPETRAAATMFSSLPPASPR